MPIGFHWNTNEMKTCYPAVIYLIYTYISLFVVVFNTLSIQHVNSHTVYGHTMDVRSTLCLQVMCCLCWIKAPHGKTES